MTENGVEVLFLGHSEFYTEDTQTKEVVPVDITYYNLKTRRVKVSGGEELVTFVPAPAAKPAGEVLDFEQCRRKLERQNAWKELERAAHAPRKSVTLERTHRAAEEPLSEKRPLKGQWLELAATLSVTLVSLSAALAFFHLI